MFRFMICGLVLLPSAALALAPKDYDTDVPDGFLTGSEVKAFEKAVQYDTDPTQAHYKVDLRTLQGVYGVNGPIPVSAFSQPKQKDECVPDRAFFLRSKLEGISLLACSIGLVGKGASLSITRDSEADETKVTVSGAMAYRFDRGAGRRQARGTKGPVLDDRAFALFLEADGNYVSSQNNDGYIRAGILGEYIIGNLGNADWGVQVKPYAQTDPGFDGRAYGLEATFTPYGQRSTLNVYKPDAEFSGFGYSANFEIDMFKVTSTGTGELTDEDEYVWIGGRFGVLYQINTPAFENGLVLSAELAPYQDVLGGRSAVSGKAGITLNLTNNATLTLEYARGRQKETLEKQDQVNLAFGVKF